MKRPNLVAKRTENPSLFLFFFRNRRETDELLKHSTPKLFFCWWKQKKFARNYTPLNADDQIWFFLYQIKCDDEQGKVWLGEKNPNLDPGFRFSFFKKSFEFPFLEEGETEDRILICLVSFFLVRRRGFFLDSLAACSG